MDANQAKTLSQNFPDVLLALLKRMSPKERGEVFSKFEEEYPKDFKVWRTADVAGYLKQLR